MKKRIIWLAILLMLVPAVLLSGCGKGEEAAGEQVLNINLGENPPDLDPQRSTDSVSIDVLNAVLEGLMRADKDGVQQPGLAADFPEVSDDGLTYTFTLRDGLTWSDGEPLTAADFEFAWKRAMSPLTVSEYNYMFECVEGAEEFIYFEELELPDREELSDEEYESALEEYKSALQPFEDAVGVKALDEKTLEVKLVQATPYFLDLCSFPTYMPAPKHLVEQYGEDFATTADKIACSGPFKMESWEPDSKIVLVKNDKYWDVENVKLEQINMFMVKEISTYMNMYETGDLDSTGVPGDYIEEYRTKDEFGSMAEAICWYLQLNREDPIMANDNFRMALSYGFDRQEFIDKVLQNYSFPATAYTPPTINDQEGNSFNETWVKEELLPKTADLEKAQDYLDKALEELGIDKAADLEITMLSGDSEVAKKYAEGVQGMLQKNLGIKVRVDCVDFATRLERMTNKQFSLVYAGWGGDYNDPLTFMDMWITDGPYNRVGYSSAEYDAAIKTAKTSTDNKTRMEAMAEAEHSLCEDLPVIPLYWPTRNFVTRPYVKDWIRRTTGSDNEWKYCWIAEEE